mmetsp:Transcript_23934/g.36620  ORF Transcript_23934/g.36620 Transcript_23934/m.36620 type:complete len:258 (-) Transcript_23934:1408-2181(-)
MLVLQEVDIHELNNLSSHIDVHLAKFAVLVDQVRRHLLHVASVLLDLVWVFPGHELLLGATGSVLDGALNDLLEPPCLLEQHGLLTVDHLRTHGVVEVSDLLKNHTFFVELLGLVNDLHDSLVHREPMLSDGSGVLYQSDELLTVVHFEEASSFVVELHELPRHLVLLLVVRVLQHVDDVVLPLFKLALLVGTDVLSQILSLLNQLLKSRHVTEEALSGHHVRVDFLEQLAGPDDGADHRGNVLALGRLLHSRDAFN